MARIILLNGAPGSGKSTLAQLWMAADPAHRTLVEVDLMKQALPMWPADPEAAARQALEVAVMAVVGSVESGADVMLPQFQTGPEFAGMLAKVAEMTSSELHELVLTLPADQVAERLADPAGASELVSTVETWTKARPSAVAIDASGAPEVVLERVEQQLSAT